MKTFSVPVVAAFLSLCLATLLVVPVKADSAPAQPEGIVQVTLEDAAGNLVPDAPLYIATGRHLHFLQGEKSGVIRFSIPEGDYKISSAMSRHSADAVDRYASLEASVHVVPGDTISVFLTLYPLGGNSPALSLSTLKKMGLDANSSDDYNN